MSGWGGLYKNTLDRLTKTQKLILKIIHRQPRRVPTQTLYQLAGVLDIRQLYMKEALTYVYKRQDTETVRHGHNTRWTVTEPLTTYRTRTTHGQRHVSYVGLKLYNRLPRDIKDVTTIRQYKRLTDNWIRTNTTVDCDNDLWTTY